MYVETNQKEERSDSMFSFFKSEKNECLYPL